MPFPPLTPGRRHAVLFAAETPHAHVHFSAADASIALADASVYFTPSTSLVTIAALNTPARAALSRSPTAETLYTADTGTAVWNSDVEGPTPGSRTPTPGTPPPSSPRPASPALPPTPRKHITVALAPHTPPQTSHAPRRRAGSPLPFPPSRGALRARCAHELAHARASRGLVRSLLSALCRTTSGVCARG
jgi:hypothetical protein